MIRLRDIIFTYDGNRPALDVPDLTIEPGLTLVVGPNGAGKSTMLRLVAGVDKPKQGTVTIENADLWRDEAAARRTLAFVPEYPELTPYATLLEVLELVAALRGATDADIVKALDEVGLFEMSRRTVRELSMGQRRRAMLATALIGDPKIVILDEPLETLDAQMRVFVRDWVFALRERGAVVLVATHDVASFAPRVDRAVSVRAGRARIYSLLNLPPELDRRAHLERLARGEADPPLS